jgi:hypothetical protein
MKLIKRGEFPVNSRGELFHDSQNPDTVKMVISLTGLGPKNQCTGEDNQKLIGQTVNSKQGVTTVLINKVLHNN